MVRESTRQCVYMYVHTLIHINVFLMCSHTVYILFLHTSIIPLSSILFLHKCTDVNVFHHLLHALHNSLHVYIHVCR